jgi:hypothetical protein
MQLTDLHLLAGLALLSALVAAVGFFWIRSSRMAALAPPPPAAAALDTLTNWQPQATRLLTVAEREAYEVLSRAFPRHIVMAQVPLARFLRVPTRYSYREWLRRIGTQCADLVLCDATTQVVAVVAVRAARPQSERALKRQARLARVLEAAEIPLHLWVEGALPSAEGARRQFGIEVPVPVRVPEYALAEAEALAGVASAVRVRGLAPAVDARTRQPDVPDEVIEMREPPNSTWFDDFDSRATPLDETRR